VITGQGMISPSAAAPPQPWDGGRGVLVLEEVLARLEQLPTRPAVARMVIGMTRDEGMSARRIAAVLSADAPLTARLMRLANSAYYGLSGRVRTLTFAVTVLGFTTARSMSLVAAAELGGPDALPVGFWHRNACTAVAAGELARPLQLDPPDAFCLGLLSGIGQALLHQADREPYSALLLTAGPDRDALIAAERNRYGASHLAVSAAALQAWSFPPELSAALRVRDRWPVSRPAENGDDLAVCLLLAGEVADRVVSPGCPPGDVRHMSGGRVGQELVAALSLRLPHLATDLARCVGD